jgi:hypothetical protein
MRITGLGDGKVIPHKTIARLSSDDHSIDKKKESKSEKK